MYINEVLVHTKVIEKEQHKPHEMRGSKQIKTGIKISNERSIKHF